MTCCFHMLIDIFYVSLFIVFPNVVVYFIISVLAFYSLFIFGIVALPFWYLFCIFTWNVWSAIFMLLFCFYTISIGICYLRVSVFLTLAPLEVFLLVSLPFLLSVCLYWELSYFVNWSCFGGFPFRKHFLLVAWLPHYCHSYPFQMVYLEVIFRDSIKSLNTAIYSLFGFIFGGFTLWFFQVLQSVMILFLELYMHWHM